MANGKVALRLRGLRKAYGDVVAVDGVDLDASAGECFALLGPNGAGKTTTIEICEGLLAADAGTVELLGIDWASDPQKLRQRLGVQLQETQLADKLTVEETLRLFRSFYERGPAVADVVAMVQLEEKSRARVGQLSGGQKQRLAIACALVGDPDLLFLDEPTTGLDPQARRQMWQLIEQFKRDGRTIILTTHYMDEAERLSDHVAIMDHGKIIALGTSARADRFDRGGSCRGVRHRRGRGRTGGLRRTQRSEPGAGRQRRFPTAGDRASSGRAGASGRTGRARHRADRAAHALRDAGGRVRHSHREAPP